MRISNKLRSFFIVLLSIVVVMAALPLNALRVNADVYYIYYHGNGGKESDGSEVFSSNSDDQGQFTILDNVLPKNQDNPGFINEGFVFTGWKDDEGHTYSINEKVSPGKDLHVNAQWAAERTINFDANYPNDATGIAGEMDPQVVGQGISTQLDANSFSCNEYYFTGWNKAYDGSGDPVADQANFTAGETDITLFAQWAPKPPRTITFYPNPPTPEATVNGTMDKIEDYQGNKVTLTANAYTCNGYIFRGWNTNSDGTSGEDFGNCATVTLSDSDIELYAKWEQGYVISFDANGGTGTMAPVEITDGSTDYPVPDSAFTRDGYKFAFWRAGDPATGTSYKKDDLLPINGNVVLYAVWYREVKLHSGETVVIQNVTVGDANQTILPATTIFTAPEGMEFLGWTTTATGKTIEYKDGDPITASGVSTDLTDLYAHWGKKVTITFDSNASACATGVSGTAMSTFVAGTGLEYTLPANSYTATGYTFDGWDVVEGTEAATVTKSGDNYVIEINSSYTGTTLTLRAKWTAKPYTVTFIYYEGENLREKAVQYSYYDVPSFTVPSRADTTEHSYAFNCWTNGTDSFTGTLPNVTGDVTYTAVYDESNRQYSVTAAVSPSDAGTITVNGSDRYSETAAFSVEPAAGYHVIGWTNNLVDAGTDKTAIDFTVTGDHKVVVYLEKDPHTVNVTTSGGGSVAIEAPEKIVYGDTVKVIATQLSGYHFVNWVDKDGNAVSTDATYEFVVTDDYEYTAVFELNTYEINITSEAHGSAEGSGTYKHFDTCTVVATPATGYHFAGWKDPVSGEIVVSKDYPTYSFTVEGSRGLVATFEINQYSITVTSGEHGSAEGGKTIIYHGDEWTVKATPDEGYHFVCWVENGTNVSSDANYTFPVTSNRKLEAVFEVNMYTVTYKDDDGTILQQSEFAWGTNAYFQKATPTKDPTAQFTYKFAGWDNKVTRVTGDVTYTAVYDKTLNQYTVTFKNADGKVLQEELVDYGTMPSYNGETPVKPATVEYTYTFAGWDQEITRVQGDITYTATYTEKKFEKGDIDYVYFKVVFNSNGGTEVTTQLVQDGYTASKPDDPMRERYNFAGWYIDEELTKPFSFSTVITSDMTLYAKWVKGVQEVEITYAVLGDGTVKWDESNTEGGVVITIDRSQDNETVSDHFKGLQIDGEDVAYFKYELIEGTDGSTSIKLSDEILDDLEPGTHTVTIVFDDGTAIVDLVIEGDETPTDGATEAPNAAEGEAATVAEASNAAIGPNYLGLWIAIGVVAFVCVCAAPILIIKRRGVK